MNKEYCFLKFLYGVKLRQEKVLESTNSKLLSVAGQLYVEMLSALWENGIVDGKLMAYEE